MSASITFNYPIKQVSAVGERYVSTFTTDGALTNIQANTNTEWIRIIDCTYDAINEEGEVEYEVENNYQLSYRRGAVGVMGQSVAGIETGSQVVNQSAGYERGTITLNPDTATVAYNDTEFQYIDIVYKNINISSVRYNETSSGVLYGFDWTDEDEKTQLRFKVTQNNTGADRTIPIYIQGTDSNYTNTSVSAVFNVVQLAKAKTAYIKLGYNDKVVSYNGDRFSVPFTYRRIVLNTIGVSSDSSWVIPTINNGEVDVKVLINTTDDERSARVTLSGTDTGGETCNSILNIIQTAVAEQIEFPIWKDTDIELTGESNYIDYRMTFNDEVIYVGRAFLNDGRAYLRVNPILKEFLPSVIDLTQTGLQTSSNYITVILQTSTDDGLNWMDYAALRTYNNWTYNDDESYSHFLTAPIMGDKVDDRQLILFSMMDTFDDTPFTPSLIKTTTIPGHPISRTTTGFTLYNQICTYVVDCRTLGIGANKKVSYQFINDSDTITFTPKRTCAHYCVYYLTKNGGYSWMFFNRASKKTDAFSFNKIRKNVVNTLPKHSDTIYQTNITEKWSLKSPYLTDSQSEKMTELFGSPQVWLHDLEKDIIVPVVVTDTSSEHLTFFNNSKKKIRYTLNVQNSQSKMRR